MKCFVICVILTCLTNAFSVAPDQGEVSAFKEWKRQFNKNYKSSSSENSALNTWKSNRDKVNEINAANLTWIGGLNQFADLTPDQFVQTILLRNNLDDTDHIFKKSKSLLVKELGFQRPDRLDWREQGIVTSVKDQGSVGSCWAFSTIGNIEGQWALSLRKEKSRSIAEINATDLSPEYLVDCDGSADYDQKHADCSVFGGWPYLAYDFIIQSGGVPSEVDWPYCSGTGKCYPCMLGPTSLCGPPPYSCDKTIQAKCPDAPPAAKISSWAAISTDEEDIADSLSTQGPLSVMLDATQLQYYKAGIWTGHVSSSPAILGCSKTGLNHAVLLVGYGTEVQSTDPSVADYWLVKNSWGAKWGEDGYFRIVRGQGACGINTAVTTSIV